MNVFLISSMFLLTKRYLTGSWAYPECFPWRMWAVLRAVRKITNRGSKLVPRADHYIEKPFFMQTACAEQLQGRNCNVSDPVYTDPDKFLNRQKLAWIRLSITRDPRNRASFWAAKCAGFWPDQIYRYGSTFTRTSVNTWTVVCKFLHRLRGKSLQPSYSLLLKRPAQCWPWQNFERSRVKITVSNRI